MRPAQVSEKLRLIATAINNSSHPRLDLVLEDIRLILAALERPKKYFAFPTDVKTLHPLALRDPRLLEDMLDKIKDDYLLAQIYGDIVGYNQKDDFYWVIAVDTDDDDLIEEILELGIAEEIDKSDVTFVKNIDPTEIWKKAKRT